MRVDHVLTDLLEATAAKAAASRRIDRLRDVLDTEARRRLAEEGAAPSWKAHRLGSVRLDPKPAKAYVSDPDAFASYVAERTPSEVTATITVGAADLEAAVAALQFAGITSTARVEVRPQYTEQLLTNADVLYEEQPDGTVVKAAGTVHPTTGEVELIPGTDVLPPSASLVVTLDRDRKRAELERVDLDVDDRLAPLEDELEAVEEALGTVTSPVEERRLLAQREAAAEAHAAEVGARLIASAQATGEAAADAAYADGRVVSARQDTAAGAEDVTPPELAPVAPDPDLDDDLVNLGTPDPSVVARVNAAAGVPADEPFDGGPDGTEDYDPVTALALLPTDALKRAARRHRLPVSGAKVILAGRLHKAGVTADDVRALEQPA